MLIVLLRVQVTVLDIGQVLLFWDHLYLCELSVKSCKLPEHMMCDIRASICGTPFSARMHE